MTPELKAQHAAADRAFKDTMSGVDKFVALGLKKKDIFRLISIHLGRHKSKHKTALSPPELRTLAAGLRALAGK